MVRGGVGKDRGLEFREGVGEPAMRGSAERIMFACDALTFS